MSQSADLLPLALQHHQAGRFADAESLYRQMLAQNPTYAEALHLLGVLTYQQGKPEAAVGFYRQALAAKPTHTAAHYNLGVALRDLNRVDEAVASFRQALVQNPNFAEAHNNLGALLAGGGQYEQAIAHYQQAISLKPNYREALINLGHALLEVQSPAAAIAAYQEAIALNPALPVPHLPFGLAFLQNDQPDEAIEQFQRALVLAPDMSPLHTHLGNAFKARGELAEALAAYRRAIELDPADPAPRDNFLYTLYFHPAYDAAAILNEHLMWNERFAAPAVRSVPAQPNDRSPGRPLRVGYVSADFRDHVVGRNILPLLRNHDRSQFHIACYSNSVRDDKLTAQFQACADQWHSIAQLSADRVAALIRQDQIDILVDLALHMSGNRLAVFAQKPAPIQITFAGYPGTTGLRAIDYRLTDPYLDPWGMDSFYSEKVLRLADSFWCYDPLATEPNVNELPALKSGGGITFACLNNFCKITEPMLALWSRVLQAVPASRLHLLTPRGSARTRLIAALKIDPARITFFDRRSRVAYLALYHHIDICLDTLPYNGHTTSLDAYWMGVPVVTLAGQTVVSRAGLSQLTNLGLPELAATTPDQFVQIATALANDLPRLANLRATLRDRMKSSPLMNAPLFARNIESAYRTAWRTIISNQSTT
jgi:protein O-GlcNAc transferase